MAGGRGGGGDHKNRTQAGVSHNDYMRLDNTTEEFTTVGSINDGGVAAPEQTTAARGLLCNREHVTSPLSAAWCHGRAGTSLCPGGTFSQSSLGPSSVCDRLLSASGDKARACVMTPVQQ